MQYVYLSYPKDDGLFAQRLVDDLQTEHYMVFMDAVSEPGSMAWAAETRRAIRGSGVVVLILSPGEEGRRTGIRLEGIGAKRRGKPVIVIRRSPGDLPRYVHDATLIDGTGPYEATWEALRAALPPAFDLLKAAPPDLRPMRRPPRQPADALRRRRVLIVGVLLLVVVLVLGLWLIPV